MGNGGTADQPVPFTVPGLSGVVELGAGQNHTCARLTGGVVACMGDNFYGQMGNGATADVLSAAVVPGVANVLRISSGNNFNCAVLLGGSVACWGYGLDGHFGDGGGTNEVTSPVPMSNASGVAAVYGLNSWSFIVDASGTARVLGFVGFGATGIGLDLRPTRPISVDF
jgi:alpha-tubulin suppressor-like RCC1 family protein